MNEQKINVSLEVEADSIECARTIVYQALIGFKNVEFPDSNIEVRPLENSHEAKHKFWEGQDWFGKTLNEISQQTGQSYQVVRMWRSKIIGSFDPRFPRKWAGEMKSRWDAADWTKQDIELAHEFRISRERVRQIRKQLNKPASPFSQSRSTLRPPKYVEIGRLLKERENDYKGCTVFQMARTFGVSASLMQKAITNAGIKHVNPKWKHPWKEVNWKLPNKALEKAWGISGQQFAAYRYEHRIGKPAWVPRFNNPRPEYEEALAKEIEKAKLKMTLTEV